MVAPEHRPQQRGSDMMNSFKLALTAFGITAGVIKGAPALAQDNTSQNVSIVRTADLDLTSKAGRAQLDHRLVTAAFEVCGTASNVDLAGKNDVRACRSNVLAKARADGQQLASRGASILVAAR
jgi:UrcA family protein